MVIAKKNVLKKEHAKKISDSLKGKKKSQSHCLNISIAAKKRLKDPRKNPNFSGDDVGYQGIHLWIRKKHGNPLFCAQCKLEGAAISGRWNIEWALKKGKNYERKKVNFLPLCKKCHIKYDTTEIWNKNISLSKKNTKTGESNHKCKHTYDQIREIRRLYALGHSSRKLAEIYGYKGHQTILDIVNYKKWKIIEVPK